MDVDVYTLADEPATRIGVHLTDSIGDVTLEQGDRLVATTDIHDALELEVESDGVYVADLPDVTTLTFTDIAFERVTAGEPSAPDSTVEVPGPLLFSTPDGSEFSYSTDLVTIDWSNPLPYAELLVWVYPCLTPAPEAPSLSLGSDPGGLVNDPSELLATAPNLTQCLTLRIGRRIEGTADAQLHSESTIRATYYDYIDITLVE
jgi:hypothetical protein